MADSFHVVAAADGCRAEKVDAAPGIEAGIEPTELGAEPRKVWLLTVPVGRQKVVAWSDDRKALDDIVRRRGYRGAVISFLGPGHFAAPNPSPGTPRDYSIQMLDLEDHQVDALMDAGVKTLGNVADMTQADFQRAGFTPPVYRAIQQVLGSLGLRMSFDLFRKERRAWSPKRRTG
jgi:hypothetical protein